MKTSQQPNALRARDDGLRRVRKLTWRAGLLAAAGAIFVGARFAHLSPSLPHLSGDLSGGQASSSSGQPGTTSPGSSPSGVSPAGGAGQVTSGGS